MQPASRPTSRRCVAGESHAAAQAPPQLCPRWRHRDAILGLGWPQPRRWATCWAGLAASQLARPFFFNSFPLLFFFKFFLQLSKYRPNNFKLNCNKFVNIKTATPNILEPSPKYFKSSKCQKKKTHIKAQMTFLRHFRKHGLHYFLYNSNKIHKNNISTIVQYENPNKII